MPKSPSRDTDGKDVSLQDSRQRSSISVRLEQFEKRQRELWRITFLILFVIAAGFAVLSWQTVRSLAYRFEAAIPGFIVLVVLFVIYAWKRNQEISELRGLLHGIEQRDASPPSEKQMDQLFGIIARSQQGYRDLIDSFDDVLLALSLEGDIRAANRSFADLVGQNFQQIIGRNISAFLEEASGAGHDLIERAMPRFLERRQWTGVLEIRLKNRNAVYFFDCIAHAMTRESQVHGVTILARDVTALRRNEARFTELFETLQEGIYIITPDDRILDANPALVRMLGYSSKEELLACKVSDIFPDEALRGALRSEVDRQPVLEGREIMLIRKDRRPLICLNTAAAVRDNAGKIIRYQGALMDITVRREMEHRLYKQQEFARRLVDSFPDLILVLDTGARYTFISPRIREVLGYGSGEDPEMQLGGRTHPEDQPALRALFDEMIAGQQSFASLEVRVRHKLGDWRRIRCNFSPLFSEEGKIEGVVISGRDVTELKRLEEQLIQAEKLAAMGQMLAGVAHELNNPLTAILGVTELIKERKDLEQPLQRQLDLTHRQARRAARIVQNLLEFSRPAAPQKKPVDLNAVIERTLQLHEHSLRRNNIEVDFHARAGIPEVIGDANQLIQVFLNLVSNAEHAIREIRDSGRIQIGLASSGRRVSVTVQDDGIGVKAEAIPRIFDPFYTTKRPGGGTGLGLSICMSILREHGGAIEAEPLPAGGSAFTVYLPVAGAAPLQFTPKDSAAAFAEGAANNPNAGADSFVTAAPAVEAAKSSESKSARVLVLDDEESIRELLGEGLAAQKLAVDCAATVEEALRWIARNGCDVVLCDLNLSQGGNAGGGKSAAERVLAAAGARKPAVIYMTGEYMDDARRTQELGEAACLQKPFRIADVVAEIRRVISDRAGK